MNLPQANISGPNIKSERLKRGWGQIDLAVALADLGIVMDRSDISEIELQKRGLKDFELDGIAKVLNVNPMLLLRGTQKYV